MKCRHFFNFALPSELLCKRTAKFLHEWNAQLWVACFLFILYFNQFNFAASPILLLYHSWWIKDRLSML